mmetsp:Transcript_30121/g.69507  ORF Transcript_30121/g.69507 Transcript_30121/m.69507 type:complete len:118 (+) Transcript_30121:479-832(+)
MGAQPGTTLRGNKVIASESTVASEKCVVRSQRTKRDDPESHHVEVVCFAFFQFVFWVVDDPHADVLIHKEEARQQNSRETAEELHPQWDGIQSHHKAPPTRQLHATGNTQRGYTKLS